MGNDREAHSWLTQLQQLMATLTLFPESRAESLMALALHALFAGEQQQALTYAKQGWQIAAGFTGYGHTYALVILGHTQVAVHQLHEAAASYQQAITSYLTPGGSILATEPQAGLAQIALMQGHLTQAQTYVEEILSVLAVRPLHGLDEPFSVYLTCYDVLAANYDSRAEIILQTAYTLLQQYADNILDDRLRHSFLENVAVHHKLQQLYEQWYTKSIPA